VQSTTSSSSSSSSSSVIEDDFFFSKQQQKEDPQKKLTKCVKKERLLQKLGKTMGKPNTTLPSDVFALIDEALSHDKLGHKPKKKACKMYK
jgi:hypothetical protein